MDKMMSLYYQKLEQRDEMLLKMFISIVDAIDEFITLPITMFYVDHNETELSEIIPNMRITKRINPVVIVSSMMKFGADFNSINADMIREIAKITAMDLIDGEEKYLGKRKRFID